MVSTAVDKTSEGIDFVKSINENAESRRYSPEGDWTIVIPIENLELCKRALRIGLVNFFKLSKFHVAKYTDVVANILKPKAQYTPRQKEEMVKFEKKEILTPLVGRTCAEIHVSGMLDEATDEALDIVDESLNILKLYRYQNDDFYSRYFGIPGTVVQNVRRTILRLKDDYTYYSPTSSWIGHLFPFEIDEKRLHFMKRNGLARIAKLVGKDSRNSLEDRIIASIYWFAKAFDVAIATTPRMRPIYPTPFKEVVVKGIKSESMVFFDRLIKLMICAETLFLFSDEPKRANISERAALLLGKTYAAKRELKQFFGIMYDKRSAIVHRGKAQLTQKELIRLTLYLQAAIITLVKSQKRLRISSEDDLREWFERKKLGG